MVIDGKADESATHYHSSSSYDSEDDDYDVIIGAKTNKKGHDKELSNTSDEENEIGKLKETGKGLGPSMIKVTNKINDVHETNENYIDENK